jgi:hypothetical protein
MWDHKYDILEFLLKNLKYSILETLNINNHDS